MGCQGRSVTLHCKYPRVLNIYAATYGRALEDEQTCASDDKEPPPFGEVITLLYMHFFSCRLYPKRLTVD